jgi:hypothetical protein
MIKRRINREEKLFLEADCIGKSYRVIVSPSDKGKIQYFVPIDQIEKALKDDSYTFSSVYTPVNNKLLQQSGYSVFEIKEVLDESNKKYLTQVARILIPKKRQNLPNVESVVLAEEDLLRVVSSYRGLSLVDSDTLFSNPDSAVNSLSKSAIIDDHIHNKIKKPYISELDFNHHRGHGRNQ